MWRQPVINSASILMSLTLVCVCALVAGCTSTVFTPDTCPSEYTAAVVWTSRTDSASAIQFFSDDDLIAEIPINVQEVGWTDDAPIHHDGKIGFLSIGNGWLKDGRLVTMSLATCQITLTKIDEPLINIASSSDGFLTVGNLNGSSYIHKFFDDGTKPVTASFESEYITAIQATDDYVFALSDNVVLNSVALLVIRSSDLSEVDRVSLPMMATGETSSSMTYSAGKLIIPMPVHEDKEARQLIIIDQNDLSVHTLQLDAPSPFYVRSVGDTVYVAHTFMNSGFRDLSQYNRISVVNMADETSTTHELPASVSRFDVNPTTLAVLGPPTDDGTAVLHTYTLPNFDPLVSIKLKAPSSVPNPFAATLFLPQP